MRPAVLVISPAVPVEVRERLAHRFEVLGPVAAAEVPALLCLHGARIEGILARSGDPLDRAALALLPALRVVACITAGTEGVDVAALRERSVAFATTSAVLADEVADVAIALMLMARRRLVEADGFVRRGAWTGCTLPLTPGVKGRRLGLLGFGGIGQAIAKRGAVTGMQVRYCATRPKDTCSFAFRPTPTELAADSDGLVVCCPGACCKRIDDQAVAVLHQRMAHEAELRLLARPLAVKLRIGIGGGGMGVVAALLAAEVLLAIAPGIWPRPGAVLRPASTKAMLLVSSEASAKSPRRAPATVTSMFAAAPAVRLGRSQVASSARLRVPTGTAGQPWSTAGAASGSPNTRSVSNSTVRRSPRLPPAQTQRPPPRSSAETRCPGRSALRGRLRRRC
jgi:hypothetical protein